MVLERGVSLSLGAAVKIAITFWPKLRIPVGLRVRTNWPAILSRLASPKVVTDKLDTPGFAFATFDGDRRLLAGVQRVYAIGLDFDKDVDLGAIRKAFATTASFTHTTWNSTPDVPRARTFVLLSRGVTAIEYRILYRHVARLLEEQAGIVVDRAASDPSRLWFLPSIPPGGVFESFAGDGAPMNVPDIVNDPELTRSAPRPALARTTSDATAYDRARAYLAKCPGAVSGSGGHNTTFITAQKMVRSFALSVDDAFALLASEWNPRCSPPWSDRELRRKVEQAASAGRMAEGDMLERRR